jgi:predicted esterase
LSAGFARRFRPALAPVRAIEHVFPVFGPGFAPDHGLAAMGAGFLRQISLFRHFRHGLLCGLAWLLVNLAIQLCTFTAAQAQAIAPYKDAEFGFPGIISGAWEDGYVVVDYDKRRDIHQRDEVPEKRVKRNYVSLNVRGQQANLKLPTILGEVAVFAAGQAKQARFIVIYVHGQGGSRLQGADDYTFGGNFNRLKNLAARNGGLYLSPDFTDFGTRGIAEIAALIGRARVGALPNAPVIVACASQGGAICNGLALSPVGGTLGGIAFLGASPDGRLTASDAYQNRVPIYIGHGSDDSVFAISKVEAFFRQISAKAYPARMVRFETGSHGTPIRMTDWRQVLNWMIGQ